jgi:hypothetical protein
MGTVLMGGGGLKLGNHRTSGLTDLVQSVPRHSWRASRPGVLYFPGVCLTAYSIQSHCNRAHRCGVSGWPIAAMSKA